MKKAVLVFVLLPLISAYAVELDDFAGRYELARGDRDCTPRMDIGVNFMRTVDGNNEYMQGYFKFTTWKEDDVAELSFYRQIDELNQGYFQDNDVITLAKTSISLEGNKLEIHQKGKVYLSNSYTIPIYLLNYKVNVELITDGVVALEVRGIGAYNRECIYKK